MALSHGRRALEAMLYVLKYLKLHSCIDCGETDPRVLDFDHFGPKRFTIGDALTRGLNVSVVAAEIEQCHVRCSNCHRKRHYTKSYRTMTVEQLELELKTKPQPKQKSRGPAQKNRKSLGHLVSRDVKNLNDSVLHSCSVSPKN